MQTYVYLVNSTFESIDTLRWKSQIQITSLFIFFLICKWLIIVALQVIWNTQMLFRKVKIKIVFLKKVLRENMLSRLRLKCNGDEKFSNVLSAATFIGRFSAIFPDTEKKIMHMYYYFFFSFLLTVFILLIL